MFSTGLILRIESGIARLFGVYEATIISNVLFLCF